MKPEASKKLEELARSVPGSHEGFVTFMGAVPQKHGVEEEMIEFITSEENITSDDVLYYFYQITRYRN